MNNITNVVLNRDEGLVSYDTSEDEGMWDVVCWCEDALSWLCAESSPFINDINHAIRLFPKVIGGVEALEVISKPVQVKQEPTPDYYNYTYKGHKLDVYRICQIVGINGGPREHALKKIVRGVNKGDIETDLELIESLEGILARWREMLEEDAE